MNLVGFFLIFCLIGGGLEWVYGKFWGIVGTELWIYPHSWLHYTSLEGLPLWGFGGLICIAIYRAITERTAKYLPHIAVLLTLDALWILAISFIKGEINA